MPRIGEWDGPFELAEDAKFPGLQEVSGVYCVMVSDEVDADEVERILGYRNRIVDFGSGYIGERLEAHADPDSTSGDEEIQQLIEDGVPLECHILPIDDVTEKQLRGYEGDLIDSFHEEYRTRPMANQKTPSEGRKALPRKYFDIIGEGALA